jgi:hypothetical protein
MKSLMKCCQNHFPEALKIETSSNMTAIGHPQNYLKNFHIENWLCVGYKNFLPKSMKSLKLSEVHNDVSYYETALIHNVRQIQRREN